jgi:hypothetical protein
VLLKPARPRSTVNVTSHARKLIVIGFGHSASLLARNVMFIVLLNGGILCCLARLEGDESCKLNFGFSVLHSRKDLLTPKNVVVASNQARVE